MTKKPKKEVLKPVEIISYAIKMVIPTGQYANIQPEIIVKADSLEAAENYIAPHMNKLWKEYFMISERPLAKPAPAPTPTPAPEITVQVPPAQEIPDPVVPVAPATAVAFEKASKAIESCLGNAALDLIIAQVKKSVKLDETEKGKLMLLAINKIKQFNQEAVDAY